MSASARSSRKSACRRAAGRRFAPGLGHAGAELVLEQRQHRCAARGCGGRPGRRCAGPSQTSRPSTWQAVTVSARARRAEDAGSRRRTPAHAGQGPSTRAAREPQQHGLGLVVAGVPQQHRGGGEPLGDLLEDGVPRPRAAASGPSPAASTATRTATGLVRAHRGHPRHDRAATAADPSCRPWSTVTAATRHPALCPRGPSRRAGPSSRRPRSRRPRDAAPGRRRSVEAAAYGEPDGGDGGVQPPPAAQPRTRDTQTEGSGSRPWTGGGRAGPRRR